MVLNLILICQCILAEAKYEFFFAQKYKHPVSEGLEGYARYATACYCAVESCTTAVEMNEFGKVGKNWKLP